MSRQEDPLTSIKFVQGESEVSPAPYDVWTSRLIRSSRAMFIYTYAYAYIVLAFFQQRYCHRADPNEDRPFYWSSTVPSKRYDIDIIDCISRNGPESPLSPDSPSSSQGAYQGGGWTFAADLLPGENQSFYFCGPFLALFIYSHVTIAPRAWTN